MPWQRDPRSGEWTMVDAAPAPAAPVASQLYVPADQTDAGYDVGDDGVYPVQSPQMAPSRSPEGGYVQRDVQAIPNASAGAGPYQNEDMAAIDQWVQEAQARGNEIRRTGVGTFEVDPHGNIVSPMPSPYKVN